MDSIFLSSVFFRLARALGALAAFSLGLAAFAASEPSAITGQKKSFAYSWQEEVQMGAEADKEVVEEMGLYENPALQTYIETLGQRLVQVSAFTGPNSPEIYRNTKFTFRIIDSPVVNAFALPGGYVYVTRGLLAHVENEAQLAVVLGHEIAHIAARHSSQQARRNQWGQIGLLLGSVLGQKVLGEKVPDIGSTILNAGGKATEMFLLRYSREAENESDSLGVTYATRAGYAAAESSRFFQALQRISAAEGGRLPTWQSTHPDPGDRARRVVQLAASSPVPNGQPVVGQDEFLRHVDGLVVGDDPREGFAQNGIFYHPTLRFQLPLAPGWKVDNQKSAVTFAQPNGSAQIGLRLAEGSRARDAAYQFIQKTGVQVVANGDTTVNGLPTTVIIGKKDTESGAVEAWNAFIEMDNRVFSLLGLSSQQTFEQFRSTFESTAAGFAPLRDNQAAAVQPAMLKIVRADRAGPFASFVPTSLPQDLNAEEIAIMNQVAMNESIPAGRLLKVPEVQAAARTPERSDNRRNRGDRDRDRNRYPQSQTPRYPEPTTYPEASRYPQTTYPAPQSGYPDYTQSNRVPQPQGNPTYPSSSYPTQSNPQQNYPQQTYPPQNYPQQNYPQSANPTYSPSGYPQFPQPSGAQSTQRPAQNPPPAWPR